MFLRILQASSEESRYNNPVFTEEINETRQSEESKVSPVFAFSLVRVDTKEVDNWSKELVI